MDGTNVISRFSFNLLLNLFPNGHCFCRAEFAGLSKEKYVIAYFQPFAAS